MKIQLKDLHFDRKGTEIEISNTKRKSCTKFPAQGGLYADEICDERYSQQRRTVTTKTT